MKKIVFLLLSFLFCYYAFAEEASVPHLVASYQGATLAKQNGIYIIDMHGTYTQMGEQYGALLKQPLYDFYKQYKHSLKLNAFIRNVVLWIRKTTLPKAEKDFLAGVAKTSGLSPSRLMLLDQSVQMIYVAEEAQKIGLGCSVICVTGAETTSGQMIIARNFDWAQEYRTLMTPYLTVAIFHPNLGNAFATVSYVGSSLGAVTAMNEKGLYIELNSAINSVGPYIRVERPSYFAQMMNMMQNSNNFAQLREAVMTTPPDESYTLTIADAKQSASIEVSSAPFVRDFAKERTSTNRNSIYKNDHSADDFLIATNSYRAKGWADTLFAKAYPTFTTTQSFERYDNLYHWAKKHQREITPILAQKILLTPINEGGVNQDPVATLTTNHVSTYYSLIAIPARLEWQLKVPSTPYPWTVIDLGNYFFKAPSELSTFPPAIKRL